MLSIRPRLSLLHDPLANTAPFSHRTQRSLSRQEWPTERIATPANMTALVSIVWYAGGSGRREEGRHTMAAQAKRTDWETGAPARVDLDELRQHRLRSWRQTRETRLRDVE